MKDRQDGTAGRAARPGRRSRWSGRRRSLFLSALAAYPNVAAAARAAGVSRSGAYELKARDEIFAWQWRAAVDDGYSELELSLMLQALKGTVRTEVVFDGATSSVKQIKLTRAPAPMLGLRLLEAHRSARPDRGAAAAGGDAEDADAAAVVERLLQDMDVVYERLQEPCGDADAMAEGEAESDETEPSGMESGEAERD
ncbi:hypothetical protein SLG_33250 [Sphingobium sp. SYK-6]|uniref:hypothetical protein n=1 Tax=Sphingobium sp. (strain NBRC 103272 / SYK-6) TaxID=627192 RepID=UPI0002276FC7|nr:hypothetical protein [Sphingobium sp. SYK-6]BAK68000.1 hypothetical protein SLG_33250 [Sphingobium sp. SYK-6]